MIQAGLRVRVQLPRGELPATVTEVRGEQCRCSFDDGRSAWVPTSSVAALEPSQQLAAPPVPMKVPAGPTPARALPRRWAWWVGAAVAVIALSAAGALVSWRKLRSPAPVELARESQQLLEPVPPELRGVLENVSLAFSVNGYERDPASTHVVIDREAVYVGAERVAALEPLRKDAKLQRVDSVFNTLKAQRTAWKATHPNAEFSGQLSLWVDESTSMLLVKSVFQTAAFAGYPNSGFELRSRSQPAKVHELAADARVPAPPHVDPGRDRILVARVRGDRQVELAWRGASLDPQERSVELKNVGSAMVELWSHRPPGILAPTQPEQARVFVADELPFRDLGQLLDGLAAPRFFPTPDPADNFAVFRVELLVNYPEKSARELADDYLRHAGPPKIRFNATTVSGRLAPEKIQAVVRRSFDVFRRCYERGLARDPNLEGRVQVHFVIARDGSVSDSAAAPAPDSTLADLDVQRCIVSGFGRLVFPVPEGGIVKVVYPLQLAPG